MTTLQKVMDDQRAFAIERDWGQFHSPKNLAMALGGEVGELSIAVADALSTQGVRDDLSTLESVTSEIADVTLYLLRLFDVLGCDVPEDHAGDVWIDKAIDRQLAVLLALAKLVGSVGAVLEIWQWSGSEGLQAAPHAKPRILSALRDLADLAAVIGVELAGVASVKLAENALRYPVAMSFGSSAKYTEQK